MLRDRPSPETLDALNDRFRERPPEALLAWTFDTFGDDAVMGTGFGYSGVALMHMVAAACPGATVFYLDTGLLFAETRALRDRLTERLDLHLVPVHPALSLDAQTRRHGPDLWHRDPDHCCTLRKVRPLQRFLTDHRAWITALRRDQGPSRADTRRVEWSARCGVVKVNPLAGWSRDDVWRYVRRHRLPTNTLHERGYPSIGCLPCTHPVASPTDERAGRWPDRDKTECGLHLAPDAE